MRERATYRYLKALDAGDIDTVIEVLQQAVYDAPLEQAVLESHQTYFQAAQDEQRQQATLTDVEGQMRLPATERNTLRSGTPAPRRNKRRIALWIQVAVALLIVGVLVGGLLKLIVQMQSAQAPLHPTPIPTPTVAVCKPYSWQVTGNGMSGNLAAIVALSANDAWAVGDKPVSQSSPVPVIEHWDGQRWSTVANPTPPDGLGTLQAIAAVSPNDVWAVGEQYKNVSAPSSAPHVQGHVLVEHWNGKHWSLVNAPNPMGDDTATNTLQSIVAFSSSDIWAVGSATSLAQQQRRSFIEHWDGHTWSIVPDAGSNGRVRAAALWSIEAIGNGQVLAGGAKLGSDGQYHAWMERWNGQQWSDRDVTQLGQESSAILSLSVLAENDIWAVVQYSSPNNGPTYNRLAHWDGQNWNRVQVPDWMKPEDTPGVSTVIALARNAVWAIGDTIVNGNSEPFIAHWDGKSWQQEQIVTMLTGASPTKDFRVRDLAVAGEVSWIVGSMTPSYGQESDRNALIEQKRLCP